LAESFTVSVTARVAAPAARVYNLVADYRDGHPRIVPPEYFRNLEVEEGGYGAGTKIRFDMTVLGSTRQARAVVSEPDPGRVLVETELHDGIVTTFTVNPIGAGECDVTIASEFPPKPGFRGTIERVITTRILPKIYRAELARIGTCAASER
jgi:hypothetical protein